MKNVQHMLLKKSSLLPRSVKASAMPLTLDPCGRRKDVVLEALATPPPSTPSYQRQICKRPPPLTHNLLLPDLRVASTIAFASTTPATDSESRRPQSPQPPDMGV